MTTTIDAIAIGQELPTLVKEVSPRRIDAYFLGEGFIKGGTMSMAFVKPVYAGDRQTVHGVVTDKHAEAITRVVVDVRCMNQDGATTAIGTASGVIR